MTTAEIDARRLLPSGRSRAAAWAAAAILAALSAALAAGAIVRERAPETTLALSPFDGFAPANVALHRLRAIQPDGRAALTRAQEREQRALAAASRRREPLLARPLALLGMAAQRRGDTGAARGLMTAARDLSRRDPTVNAWFVADAGRRGDLDAAVANIGRSILTEPSTASLYLPQLAATLADPSTIPAFAHILRSRPAWEELFWREAAVNPAALRDAGELRAVLHRTAAGDMPINRALLQQLAGGNHLDTAERLYRSIAPRARADAPIVRDGEFRARPALPPFDWQEIASGDQTGTVDPAGRRLLIGGVGGAGGPVARQLVRLPAGRYRLSAERAQTDDADARIVLEVRCALSGATLAELALTNARAALPFSNDAGCGLVWLDVNVVPSAGGDSYDLALRRVAIERWPR